VSVRIRAVPGGATGLSSEEQVAKAKAAIITHIAEWTKNNALQEVRCITLHFPRALIARQKTLILYLCYNRCP
jgi:hypothetical protein